MQGKKLFEYDGNQSCYFAISIAILEVYYIVRYAIIYGRFLALVIDYK